MDGDSPKGVDGVRPSSSLHLVDGDGCGVLPDVPSGGVCWSRVGILPDGYPDLPAWWELRNYPTVANSTGPATTTLTPIEADSLEVVAYGLEFTDTDGARQGHRDPETGVPIPGDWETVNDGVRDLLGQSTIRSCTHQELNPHVIFADGTEAA